MGNISGAELADMQLISRYNVGILLFLSVVDILSNYTWIAFLKDEKGGTITEPFHKIVKESRVNQTKYGLTKAVSLTANQWLRDNYIEIYFTHNEE